MAVTFHSDRFLLFSYIHAVKQLIPVFSILFLLALIMACGNSKSVMKSSTSSEVAGGGSDQDFMDLVDRMSGSFSSAQQAKNDSDLSLKNY